MSYKYEYEKRGLAALIVVGIFTIIVGLGIWVFISYNEAQAYNRLTGQNVSTWDAMWVELRVQDAPKKRD